MAATKVMKRKELEQHLQDVEGFERPKILLEQYETRAHIAACMLHTMESAYGDLLGKTVLDLGCGCSVLSIGAALLGSSYVLGVDLDADALAIASANVDQFESMTETIHFLQTDAKLLPSVLRDQIRFDTVIMVRLFERVFLFQSISSL